MKAIVDRAEAAALPSRHHFALFRLVATLRFPAAPKRVRSGTVLHLDEYQSAFENYSVSAVIWLVTTAYLVELLSHVLPLGIAIPVAMLLSPLALQIPFYVSGAIASAMHDGENLRLNSVAVMASLLGASAYHASQQTWTRWPARGFLALAAANAVAAPLVWLMRGRIAEQEERCAR